MKLPINYWKLDSQGRRVVREEYIRLQEGKCAYCHEALNSPPPKWITDIEINWSLFPGDFLKHPVHLQHDHTTGMTEGAVHAYCNAVLWQQEGR